MLKGKYPKILKDKIMGKEAIKLFEDANLLLDKIVLEHSLSARAVIGIYPASSKNEIINVFSDKSKLKKLASFHFLRQQNKKGEGRFNSSLADYVAPVEEKNGGYIGFFALTAGLGIKNLITDFEKEKDDYHIIMVKALADRMAEAFAELMHEKVRKKLWGYASNENLDNDSLIREAYQGIRPAPGYPACPDHTEKRTLFNLLEVEKNIGIKLTENFAMYPTASVSGYYFAHPKAKYFGVGKIGKDQVKIYAKQKKIKIQEAERWLKPNLGY
jgi:5-methyltetrahydrofolate--homocysteine methyltransferase